jgi:hypothetical protein
MRYNKKGWTVANIFVFFYHETKNIFTGMDIQRGIGALNRLLSRFAMCPRTIRLFPEPTGSPERLRIGYTASLLKYQVRGEVVVRSDGF